MNACRKVCGPTFLVVPARRATRRTIRPGPASITHGEIAAALTSALGRDITFIDVPPRAFADSLQGILPPWQIQGLLEDCSHYRRGKAASVSPAIAEITGKPATEVRQFARDHVRIFVG